MKQPIFTVMLLGLVLGSCGAGQAVSMMDVAAQVLTADFSKQGPNPISPQQWDAIDASWVELCRTRLTLTPEQSTSFKQIWHVFLQQKTEHNQAVAYKGAAQLDIEIQQERKAALDQMNGLLKPEQQTTFAKMRMQLGN